MTRVLLNVTYLGIVHMDVNPENVFISIVAEDSTIEAMLGDFGFSLLYKEGTIMQPTP